MKKGNFSNENLLRQLTFSDFYGYEYFGNNDGIKQLADRFFKKIRNISSYIDVLDILKEQTEFEKMFIGVENLNALLKYEIGQEI